MLKQFLHKLFLTKKRIFKLSMKNTMLQKITHHPTPSPKSNGLLTHVRKVESRLALSSFLP